MSDDIPFWRDGQAIQNSYQTITSARPSVSRIIDYLLDGKDNFAIDRERAREAIAADPAIRKILIENRRFSRRVVRYLASECGIAQFIDIGMGLPAAENVHQVAQHSNPKARVAYVDNDPIVVAHGQALLAENNRIKVISADLRNPEEILHHPEFTQLIDLDEPVAVLLTPVLHFISDDDRPDEIMNRIRIALAPGSYLAISHACPDIRPNEVDGVMEVYRHATSATTARSRERIQRFFGDFNLVSPGMVWIPSWKPDIAVSPSAAERIWHLGGVARKPVGSPIV